MDQSLRRLHELVTAHRAIWQGHAEGMVAMAAAELDAEKRVALRARATQLLDCAVDLSGVLYRIEQEQALVQRRAEREAASAVPAPR